MGAKATYVYCAVQARHEPNLGRAPSGLAGLGKLRPLDAGRGLWLVVADAPLSRYGEASIQRGLGNLTWLSRCAVAHEAVLEHCLRAPAVVPMKLFTIFDSDVRALAEIGRKRPQLDRVMRLVAGRREWGVRIRAVPAPSRLRTVRPLRNVRNVKAPSSGASYLAAKQHARNAARELAEREHARVNRTFATLAALAVDARRHPPVAGAEHTRLLLDAAFLVGTRAAARFRALTRRVARDLGRNGYGVELTGPWPPYNFT
jgi:gas vesicle protein GvpL/GvpF